MGKINMFEESGYLDIAGIRKYMEDSGITYTFIWGSRGIGKTYGVLKEQVRRNLENNEKFIMLRRTKTQVDLITNERFMPFKSFNADYGTMYRPYSIGSGMYGFFDSEIVDNKYKQVGEEIGLAMAVSTSGNVRGYDGYDISFVFYDEFIPLKAEHPIRGEAGLLFNTLETIGRNRELKDGKPLYFMGLSNSNDVDNPYFLELGVVDRALKMSRSEENEIWIDRKRGLMLICVNRSPISALKKDTALYKLTAGTDFAKMALDNDFVNVNTESVRSMDLKHYDPLAALGGICIYKRKGSNTYYVSEHVKGRPKVYSTAEIDLDRFRLKFAYLYSAYMQDRILFENHASEYLFQVYLKV